MIAMDVYALLRLGHVVGAILLGGGLLAVFISELRAYHTDDVRVFAEAAWYTATFYDGLAVPGALFLGVSGLLLRSELGLDWFDQPWFAGMWGLFLFEVVEGNTLTRVQFRRTLRRSRAALPTGVLTSEVRAEARSLLGQIAHFLDVPLFLVIVWCGVMKPESWREVITAIVVALVAAALLTAVVPRLDQRDRPATPAR
jgi:predicted integral membrane protein DUF2269